MPTSSSQVIAWIHGLGITESAAFRSGRKSAAVITQGKALEDLADLVENRLVGILLIFKFILKGFRPAIAEC